MSCNPWNACETTFVHSGGLGGMKHVLQMACDVGLLNSPSQSIIYPSHHQGNAPEGVNSDGDEDMENTNSEDFKTNHLDGFNSREGSGHALLAEKSFDITCNLESLSNELQVLTSQYELHDLINKEGLSRRLTMLKQLTESLKEFCINKSLFLSRITQAGNQQNTKQIVLQYNYHSHFVKIIHNLTEGLDKLSHWVESFQWVNSPNFDVKKMGEYIGIVSSLHSQHQKYFNALLSVRKELLKRVDIVTTSSNHSSKAEA